MCLVCVISIVLFVYGPCIRRLFECSPNQLLIILTALAQLDIIPSDAWNRRCLELLTKYLPALGPRQVAAALTSLASLQNPLDAPTSSTLLHHILAGVHVWDADDMEAVASSFSSLHPLNLPRLDLVLLEDLIQQLVVVQGVGNGVFGSSSVRALARLAFACRVMSRRRYVPPAVKSALRKAGLDAGDGLQDLWS